MSDETHRGTSFRNFTLPSGWRWWFVVSVLFVRTAANLYLRHPARGPDFSAARRVVSYKKIPSEWLPHARVGVEPNSRSPVDRSRQTVVEFSESLNSYTWTSRRPRGGRVAGSGRRVNEICNSRRTTRWCWCLSGSAVRAVRGPLKRTWITVRVNLWARRARACYDCCTGIHRDRGATKIRLRARATRTVRRASSGRLSGRSTTTVTQYACTYSMKYALWLAVHG